MTVLKVQTLRGLACCLLVAYHVIGATDLQGLRVQEGWLRDINDALVAVRMPLMGFIAGAMYGLSSKQGWALVRNKVSRLLFPMLSVGTLFALIQYGIPYSNYRIEDLHLLHIVPVAHYWFLESLFLIFCLMSLFESHWRVSGTKTWCVYFTASLLVYLSHPGFIWFSLLGAAYLLPYFLVGMGMTRLNWDPKQQQRNAGLVLTMMGAILVLWLMFDGHQLERFTLSVLVAGLLISTGLWSLGLHNSLLARIGDYSFSIYLFHVFFTSATRMVMQFMMPASRLQVLMVCLSVGILAPIYLHRAISRSRTCSKWLLGRPTQALALA